MFYTIRCLESVVANESAFRAAVEKDRGAADPAFKDQNVVALINDRNFWTEAEALCKMLEPISKVQTTLLIVCMQ